MAEPLRDYSPPRVMTLASRGVVIITGVFVVYLASLVLAGRPWRAAAYAVAVLFALLFLQAFYFWGAMLLGAIASTLRRHRSPVPWSLGENGEVPEHDIDPGLELLAAGVLVYRGDSDRPELCFRDVPVSDLRAVRPFVVARTGYDRPCSFEFALYDDGNALQLTSSAESHLTPAANMVVPGHRLVTRDPGRLAGQRWQLQIRSGVTILTSLRIAYRNDGFPELPGRLDPDPAGEARQARLNRLLDAVLELDAKRDVPDIALEEW